MQYRPAELTADKIKQIQTLEQKLSQTTNDEIVLVAYTHAEMEEENTMKKQS